MKKFLADIATIKKAIEDKKLVIFAGAGISVDAGVPLWGKLIDSLKEDINLPDKEEDYLRIPQMYYNERQHKEYVEKVRRVLKYRQVRYNKIHEAIFDLNPEHILTTNYDDLLDQVIRARALMFSIIASDKQFPYAKNTNLLVKVHGSLESDDFVLKEDDYLEYSTNHPLIESFIRFVFTSKVVLFVGYSFSDPNLKMIIQTVRNILGKDYQNAYLLSTDTEKNIEEKDVKDLHPLKREYLKKKGVIPIHFYDEEDFISAYLNGDDILGEVYRVKDNRLSEKGKTLLDFLTFIQSYNHFYQGLSEKDIVDQQYLSLQRFDALPVLPPRFVASLYPFNKDKQFLDYEDYGMRSREKAITDLYFEQVRYDENGKIKLKENKTRGLTKGQISDQEQKLRYVVRRLNQSKIYSIRRREENGMWTEKVIQYHFKKNCNCPKCLHTSLKLDELIQKTANYNITDTSDLEEDILYAYANYKLSNFKLAYQQFEEIANKAWQMDSPMTYFIAKHNERHTRRLHRFSPEPQDRNSQEDESEENKKKRIRNENQKKIDDIDLDKLLSDLPNIDKEQREVLTIVKNHSILSEASRTIDKPKIGSIHYVGILDSLSLLYSFYTENCIVYDVFNEFKEVCEKGIESLLDNYANHESYEPSESILTEFNYLFFVILISYVDTRKAKKLFDEYEIDNLPFNEKDLLKVLEIVSNFLLSGFRPNRVNNFGSYQNLKKQVSNNTLFGSEYTRFFNNIFLVLSKIKLEQQIGEQLIKNLISFLKVESVLFWENIKYLSAFVYANCRLFSYKDCEALLRVSVNSNKNKYYTDRRFLDAIYHVFKTQSFDNRIDDLEIINEILRQCKGATRADFEYDENLLSLWYISSTEIRSDIEKIIKDKLEENFDVTHFTRVIREGLLQEAKYFKKCLKVFSKYEEDGSYNEKFKYFIYIIYWKKIELDSGLLKTINSAPKYVQFFLFPEKFDYRDFQLAWLLNFNYQLQDGINVIYERLGNIKEIRKAVRQELKKEYHLQYADMYTKYFL
uniref:SIR2 family protein n=1 Tax=Roseihalotalea indica TaxID=2867963 RepID=A0AA49GNW4_9BACT|nr:SIR2 family protein [Tunicatimonas sp. TK19036]